MPEVVDLDLFQRRTVELLREPLVESGELRADLAIAASVGQPLQLATHQPDETKLRSFLLTFRQFVSNDEPIHVYVVHNLLWRTLEGDTYRRHLQGERQRYSSALKAGPLRFIRNQRAFPPEDVLDLWINGRYFHNDRRKAAILDEMDPLGQVFVRHLLMDVLVDATNYVAFLSPVIGCARRDGLLAA